VLEQLIKNRVTIDSGMIMRALEGCFKQAQNQGTEEVVIRVTEEVIKDPTKYMSAEFIKFLLQRFMNTEGREQMVRKLMLNTKLSIQMFPDEMWDLYILHEIKSSRHQ